MSEFLATCPECGGVNMVTDSTGKYCVDCRRRPWERMQGPPQQPAPVYMGVSWAKDATGYLELIDPVSGEKAAIKAKGLRSKEGIDLGWLFSRLPSKREEWREPKRMDHHGLDRDGFIEDPEDETRVDEN